MSNEINNPDTADQQADSGAPKTTKETKVDRIANEVASRAVKRQQRYDKEHNIFTK
ncbi:MAG TPA: hypothetical protein VGM27_20570 [Acidobacteriaceae bacterium]|jgi:hypothetical protein